MRLPGIIVATKIFCWSISFARCVWSLCNELLPIQEDNVRVACGFRSELTSSITWYFSSLQSRLVCWTWIRVWAILYLRDEAFAFAPPHRGSKLGLTHDAEMLEFAVYWIGLNDLGIPCRRFRSITDSLLRFCACERKLVCRIPLHSTVKIGNGIEVSDSTRQA